MNFSSKADKSRLLTIVGMIVMILFIATKAIPSLHVEGYSILVGITFFFIIEAIGKTPEAQSGLRLQRSCET